MDRAEDQDPAKAVKGLATGPARAAAAELAGPAQVAEEQYRAPVQGPGRVEGLELDQDQVRELVPAEGPAVEDWESLAAEPELDQRNAARAALAAQEIRAGIFPRGARKTKTSWEY